MSGPVKPAKPGAAQSVYLKVPKEDISPFFSSSRSSLTHSNLATEGTGNPFDDMNDIELNRIVRSTNPSDGDVVTDINSDTKRKSSNKRPVLNSFDDVNIVSNSKNKVSSNGNKRSDKSASQKSTSSKQDESDKSRTRESRSQFMKKIRKMETKVTKNSYDHHTIMAVDNDDDNTVIRFLLSDRGLNIHTITQQYLQINSFSPSVWLSDHQWHHHEQLQALRVQQPPAAEHLPDEPQAPL